ncbi:hypothetical protein [Streptomyces europaeiscabiei]|uniref:hypothetical protein n=1 Tax=Streptomyces europaeiscabiei TaxID=146819 RepID=UPI0029AEE002|nr:hypothetical protein [Streptomyces europaeiscabiei]MDX2524624.1 hypothetical protein [Streptomyces europaeiscabiei]
MAAKKNAPFDVNDHVSCGDPYETDATVHLAPASSGGRRDHGTVHDRGGRS